MSSSRIVLICLGIGLLIAFAVGGVIAIKDSRRSSSSSTPIGMTSIGESSSDDYPSSPEEVLKKFISTCDAGDTEGARQYLTEHAKTTQYQWGYTRYDGVIGMWQLVLSFRQGGDHNFEPAYESAKISGSTANYYLVEVKNGNRTTFVTDKGKSYFTLVNRENRWQIDNFY